MTFKDHFSSIADTYAKHRPTYPKELFEFLAALAPARDLAWDCATGNGQAALALAPHFRRVIATDASADQIARAAPAAGVEYHVAPAEASGLPGESVDLLTVAQAAHWFDLPRFRAEIRRVLKPKGAIGIWTYDLLEAGPGVDPLLRELYGPRLGAYWPQERKFVDELYRTLDFGFAPIPVPPFRMAADWNLADVLAYVRTWSAVVRYRKETGVDPVSEYESRFAAAWGDPSARRTITWPLVVFAGHRPD